MTWILLCRYIENTLLLYYVIVNLVLGREIQERKTGRADKRSDRTSPERGGKPQASHGWYGRKSAIPERGETQGYTRDAGALSDKGLLKKITPMSTDIFLKLRNYVMANVARCKNMPKIHCCDHRSSSFRYWRFYVDTATEQSGYTWVTSQ